MNKIILDCAYVMHMHYIQIVTVNVMPNDHQSCMYISIISWEVWYWYVKEVKSDAQLLVNVFADLILLIVSKTL